MSAIFPGGIPTYVDPTSDDYLNNPDHTTAHISYDQEIVATDTKLGVDNSTNTNTIDSRVRTGWNPESNNPTYATTSSFTLTGDRTSFYTKGRKVRLNYASTPIYAYVSNSTFNSGDDLTTVNTTASVVPTPLDSVDYGNTPLGATTITTDGIDPSANIKGSQLSASADIAGSQLSSTAGITGGQLANETVTATQIANETITATQIANETITDTQIAANTVTGDRMAGMGVQNGPGGWNNNPTYNGQNFIVQAGSVVVTLSGGTGTVTLPQAFPGGFLTAIITQGDTTASHAFSTHNASSNAAFTVVEVGGTDSFGVRINYIAIGW